MALHARISGFVRNQGDVIAFLALLSWFSLSIVLRLLSPVLCCVCMSTRLPAYPTRQKRHELHKHSDRHVVHRVGRRLLSNVVAPFEAVYIEKQKGKLLTLQYRRSKSSRVPVLASKEHSSIPSQVSFNLCPPPSSTQPSNTQENLSIVDLDRVRAGSEHRLAAQRRLGASTDALQVLRSRQALALDQVGEEQVDVAGEALELLAVGGQEREDGHRAVGALVHVPLLAGDGGGCEDLGVALGVPAALRELVSLVRLFVCLFERAEGNGSLCSDTLTWQ